MRGNFVTHSDSTALEDIIMKRSLENKLLTPFVTLHVAKPGLRSAMNTGYLMSQFGDFAFRKKRDTDEKLNVSYQELKFRHRGKKPKVTSMHVYEPLLCGNSELLAFPVVKEGSKAQVITME